MDAIPLFDLTQQYQSLAPALQAAVESVLASGQYINGPVVKQFEAAFAEFVQSPNHFRSSPESAHSRQADPSAPSPPLEAISCNSGTDALYLALRALNIGPGDEVLTTPFSFFASAEVINQVGARPVFVDIDPRTFNLDPAQVAAQITPRTRAIMPVHLFGRPVDMTALIQVAQEHQLLVIEDCAQAIGACWAGQQVGTFGDLGCFSFYPTKNLGALGDGGVVITRHPELAAKIRCFKDHGQSGSYLHTEIGLNSRLDAIQAAILLTKLPYLREWNTRRRSLVNHYSYLLQDIPDLILPEETVGGRSVWNQFTVQIVGDRSGSPNRRDLVQQKLKAMGIGSRIYYPVPLHLQPVYQSLGYRSGDFPQAEQCANQVLSLPMFPELTGSRQERVAEGLKQVMQATVGLQIPGV